MLRIGICKEEDDCSVCVIGIVRVSFGFRYIIYVFLVEPKDLRRSYY
jgi:hypothetical protein